MNKFTFIALLLIGFFIIAVSYNAGDKKDTSLEPTSNPFDPASQEQGNTLGLQTEKGGQQELQVGSPTNNMQADTAPSIVKFTPSPLKSDPDEIIKAKINIPVPDIELKKNTDYKAVITTTMGDITIDLFEDLVPETVKNFVYLANNNYYNDIVFHRIIKGFMIQTGDPTGTGAGSPGYKFEDEKFDGQYTKGTVAMANSGPDTNGSQFFIMHGDNQLPLNYVIFGRVTDGLDTVDTIASVETTDSGTGEKSSPLEPVSMVSVKIIEVEKTPSEPE